MILVLQLGIGGEQLFIKSGMWLDFELLYFVEHGFVELDSNDLLTPVLDVHLSIYHQTLHFPLFVYLATNFLLCYYTYVPLPFLFLLSFCLFKFLFFFRLFFL